MNNETVLKITHLEGYAGLRLKDNRELEIKKGINLLVDRNGSGKSGLNNLVAIQIAIVSTHLNDSITHK